MSESSMEEIICPHCKYAREANFEDLDGQREECVKCGKEFDLTVDFSPLYTTTKLGDEL